MLGRHNVTLSLGATCLMASSSGDDALYAAVESIDPHAEHWEAVQYARETRGGRARNAPIAPSTIDRCPLLA